MPPSTKDEVLRPRKRTWALVLLICAAFVSIGFLIVKDLASSREKFWAYGGIVFFGLCAAVALIQIIPGSSFLRIKSDGITVRSMWRTTFYRWSDIERFGVAELSTGHRQLLVGLDFSASYPHRDRAQTVKRISRTLTGFEGALPDNYGRDCAELAAHLNQLREQYVNSPEPARAG
jgi:hypothetical protein